MCLQHWNFKEFVSIQKYKNFGGILGAFQPPFVKICSLIIVCFLFIVLNTLTWSYRRKNTTNEPKIKSRPRCYIVLYKKDRRSFLCQRTNLLNLHGSLDCGWNTDNNILGLKVPCTLGGNTAMFTHWKKKRSNLGKREETALKQTRIIASWLYVSMSDSYNICSESPEAK